MPRLMKKSSHGIAGDRRSVSFQCMTPAALFRLGLTCTIYTFLSLKALTAPCERGPESAGLYETTMAYGLRPSRIPMPGILQQSGRKEHRHAHLPDSGPS